ncbi:hypothetical protein [Bacillus alkalicellulosilyticus]|uniref:hypothetical protein n=1 Tax=Alkalihalobacterium alkalicellulosilyticum TaxID=1912214 RepID=UPI000995ECA6|nr:hypothetical protein [Bacillus alkalicellulosilyticus]
MYRLTDNQHFEIKQFQQCPTFSSFLPGIAGVNGIPMWVFYVNRGQAIASFGVQDKDHAIMEFFPADKSYQFVHLNGFRTFLKITDRTETVFIEPFSPQDKKNSSHTMTISENKIKLDYTNEKHGISMMVEYFILPQSPIAGLVRHVTLKNISSTEKQIEMLDGLPSILPSGVFNGAYKELGHTIKSWFDVYNLEHNIPFYKLRGSMEDSAEVKEVEKGNFYASLLSYRNTEQKLKPIIDRDLVFGTDTSLQVPEHFIDTSVEAILSGEAHSTNKVSCGFSGVVADLQGNEELQLMTILGHAENKERVNEFATTHLSLSYLLYAKEIAESITDDVTSNVATKTANPIFDAYTRQSFLDNGLRGGFPMVFQDQDRKKVFYLYSRKHGDLERDYNFFSISPTYYSQGNGNYRDINQNRRCDVFIEPKVEDYNIKLFMNLIQLDGYNPLVVKGVRFYLEDVSNVAQFVSIKDEAKVNSFFSSSFTPGELKHFIENEMIELTLPFEQFLSETLLSADEIPEAEYGEGFWIDHWTYNLDLLDSYLTIYPDKKNEMVFGDGYCFFDSPVKVKKRNEKYVTSNGKMRQYHAIEKDKEKLSQANANNGVLWVREKYGEGDIYTTTLYSKLVLLALVKTATMAPYGLGIEMEADKPGWNDSLNGLPGMFGASTSELFELKRLLTLLLEIENEKKVGIPVEGDRLFQEVVAEMKKLQTLEIDENKYWNNITEIREAYRNEVYRGIKGKDVSYSLTNLKPMLTLLLQRVESGIERLSDYGELPPTYFYFTPTINDKDEMTWQPYPVTPFLEGIVKSLKVKDDKEQAMKLYQAVRKSDIYDKKLQMYKTSMSIKDEPNELGRAHAFTPGWLENESVFLHMEYKYLLAVLKSELYEPFFEDMKHALIPFIDPDMYGRSILENSSFIASSANPDTSLHGRGFVSRLSGSTVEFLNMWFEMFAGKKPFTIDDAQSLICQLKPILPYWLFDESGEASFTFLGSCNVTYVNESRKNTFGTNGVNPVEYELTYQTGETKVIQGSSVEGTHALSIRDGKVEQIRVILR